MVLEHGGDTEETREVSTTHLSLQKTRDAQFDINILIVYSIKLSSLRL